MAATARTLFQVRGLTKVYQTGAGEVRALRGVDLDIRAGETLVLLGPSGSGKSTLLNILGGLDRATSGQVLFHGADLVEETKAAAEAAEKAVRSADALIEARRADVVAAQSLLTGPEAERAGFISITSPASGVVTHLLQQSERDILAGTPLVEIGETGGLEAQIEFLSQDAVKISPGYRAEIFNWGGPLPIPAEVRLVEPQGFTKVSALGVEEQRTLVMLQFTGPSTDWQRLGPGYRVWGRVYLREMHSAVLAPIGALVRDRGTWAVFRLEGGRARLRPVKVGAMTDRDAEIFGGLSVGDRVVEYPTDQVGDGMRVAPRAANWAGGRTHPHPTTSAKVRSTRDGTRARPAPRSKQASIRIGAERVTYVRGFGAAPALTGRTTLRRLAQVHPHDIGIGEGGVGGAGGDDAAGAQHHDVAAQGADGVHDVLHHDDGEAVGVEGADEGDAGFELGGVEAGQPLVEE
jgi:energy-coupling factor transporter ATP-binding protein EcfA2